jgi:hypothetical protein
MTTDMDAASVHQIYRNNKQRVQKAIEEQQKYEDAAAVQ